MVVATAEATWVRHLLTELGETISRSTLLCDNQSALNMSFNPVQHSHAMHIEIDQHFVRQKVEEKRSSLNLSTLKDKLQTYLQRA
jgi:hypothetical protein